MAQIEEHDAFHLVIMDLFDTDILPARRATHGDQAELERHLQRARDKYARIFATYRGARVTKTIRRRRDKGEKPTPFGAIIKVHERIKAYTNREAGSLPGEAELIEFGETLFETLFQGDVKRLYEQARSSSNGRRLDLVLTSMIPWIAEKPWEFAYDPVRRKFLAIEDVHFVRNVLTPVPADRIAPARGGLNILVASAQPVGFGTLSIEQERAVILRGFAALIDAGLAHVKMLPRATPERLRRELASGRYSIVHFIGHGEFDAASGEGALIFEDGNGGRKRLTEREVRGLFCKRGLSLIFLNSCQSGTGGLTDFNKGVAQALVANGLPALVANQYSVLDSSATSFAQEFYRALAQGRTLGEAAREARRSVNASLTGDIIDWAVPVVYARDPNQVLCAPPTRTVRGASARLRDRRGVPGKNPTMTVAVWDMDGVFPALQLILDRINRKQSALRFELVQMSVPIDVWDLRKKTRDGAPSLMVEILARRLSHRPQELNVDALCCVTRHRLSSQGHDGFARWWSEEGNAAVLIVSLAGIADTATPGLRMDRSVVEGIVAAAALRFSTGGLHESWTRIPSHDAVARLVPAARSTRALARRRLDGARNDADLLGALASILAAFEAS